ncbi:MAG TPA: diacylglycerol kinase family protein [Streptosporangiaceae bacterium]|jgi:diacylglycerol kinase family enzyme|nr:diacylglycerol kinase family protein [Streptosporangiaceae bacterium]
MPSAAIVINRTLVRDLRRFRRRCREAATASGWEPSFLETTVDERGLGLARGAVAAGARMVVAAGGDGTVRACAQALAGTQVPLAIVPLGTANLAARALGVPSRIGGALAAGFGGHERRIDLAAAEVADAAVGDETEAADGATRGPGEATGGAARDIAEIAGGAAGPRALTVAAMAGIGLDAEVVAATPRLLKRQAGWASYALAGVTHLAGPGHCFTVRLDDGEPLARWARCVVVGNAGLLPGGFVLLPRARLDDGLLDVGILAPSGPGGWLRVAHRVLTHSGRDCPQLERHQARRIEIRAGTDLPREVDGEVIAPGRSLTVTLLRRALTVRVPSPGSRSRPRC